eukprot:2512431-Pyramimonas_sp.AAC.1
MCIRDRSNNVVPLLSLTRSSPDAKVSQVDDDTRDNFRELPGCAVLALFRIVSHGVLLQRIQKPTNIPAGRHNASEREFSQTLMKITHRSMTRWGGGPAR